MVRVPWPICHLALLHQSESGLTMRPEPGAIYARRAEIETDIRQWKHTLEMEGLRGRSVEMILNELTIAVIAYNLEVQVRNLARQQVRAPAKQVSFSGAWTLCTQLLIAQRDLTPDQWAALFQFTRNKIQQLLMPSAALSRSHFQAHPEPTY